MRGGTRRYTAVHFGMRVRVASGAALLLAAGVVGCAPEAVRWTGDAVPLPGSLGAGRTLVLLGAPTRPTPAVAAVIAPTRGLPALGPGACLGSVRWARAGATDVAVAWWVARADSSVALRVARTRDDGAHWEDLPPADTRDRGVRGCARPAPSLAYDPAHGATHLAYYLEPADGAGVFYVHAQDPSPTAAPVFHAPVTIVYGGTPVEASVAAAGDLVAVAYVDPNGAVSNVDLALSRTAGHIFEPRVDVSGRDVAARSPAVALADGTVAVAWTEHGVQPESGAAEVSAGADGGARRVGRGDARTMVQIGTVAGTGSAPGERGGDG